MQDQVGLYWVRWDRAGSGRVILGQVGSCRILDQVRFYWIGWDRVGSGKVKLGQVK